MNRKEPETGWDYACEPLAGCVYGYRTIDRQAALELSMPWNYPHVIELVANTGGAYEHRSYYALDLHQAVAKAAELLVRMRRQEVSVRLAVVRPANDAETEAFFKELAKYDGHAAGETCRCRP